MLIAPRSGPWLVGVFGVVWVACGPSAPPAEAPQPPPAKPVEAPVVEEKVQISVGADGVRVQLVSSAGSSSDTNATLRFAAGDEVTGKPDYQGVVLIQPDLQTLFRNSEALHAEVVIEGTTTDVDLRPLVDAAKQANAAEWKRLADAREASRAKADEAVHFAGKVYQDPTADLVEVCTPSGAERCLDAIDNDCDGRYDDVACGYSSGVVQWTLTWAGPDDLDLHVVGPDEVDVSPANPRSDQAKLVLDHECKGTVNGVADCPDGNVENVYSNAEGAPVSGTYMAWVEVKRPADPKSREPIRSRLAGRIGKKTWYADVKLAPFEGASYRVAYPLGGDLDRDSVVDEHDACPKVPGCWFSDLKHRGCPDVDVDGVPDSIDACPKRMGLSQSDPKKNGCPIEHGAAWVTNRGIKINKRIEFAFGKADLRPESKEVIENVASAIQSRPEAITKLSVDGHTDSVGDEASNIHLSHARGRSVFLELVNQGVSAEMLLVRGFGETEPIADNATDKGRQTNRRVEFVIQEPKPRQFECWSEEGP